MNRRDQLIAQSFDRIFTHAGIVGSYTRSGAAGFEIEELDLVEGRNTTPAVDAQGTITEMESPDFLIRASSLVHNESPVEPLPGDRISTVLLDGSSMDVEVCRFAGESCWRWADPARTIRRIHTRIASRAEATS